MNFIEEKLHRDLLVSKLLRDDSIIIECGLEKNNFQKFLTRSFLFFSKESRQLIIDSPNINKQDINFQALIGIDCNNFKDQSGKITKNEILGLCNKYITLTDLSFIGEIIENQTENIAENQAEEIIKAEANKRNVIEFEKKVDDINPMMIVNSHNETIFQKKEEPDDDPLDNETLNFFRNTLNNSNNNTNNPEIIEKIGKLMKLIENSNNLTNRHKNEVLRQMKDKFLEEQENLIRKHKELEEKNKLLISKNYNDHNNIDHNTHYRNNQDRSDFNLRESIENQSNVHNITKSRIVNSHYNLNKSEMEKYKSKIIYTNQGWGITDNVKQSKNFNNKINKSSDKSFVSVNKDSKQGNKTVIRNNLKHQNLNDIKITGNQKIVKLGTKSSKPQHNINNVNNNKMLHSHKLKDSDEEFFENFD